MGRDVLWIGLVVTVNAMLAVPVILGIIALFPAMFDYDVIRDATRIPNPYDHPVEYLWSPALVVPLRVLTGFGPEAWFALHFAALVPLGWRLGGLVAVSYPFLFDLHMGNVMTFVAVAGYLAVRGSRAGMLAFLALVLLMPRPLMVPLVVWLLWREPWVRWPFAAMFVGHGLLVLGSGLALDWADRLAGVPVLMTSDLNWSPSRVLGWAWWPIGLFLAAVALRFGRVGLASLAVSPYLYPQYLLVGLFELRQRAIPERLPLLVGGGARGVEVRTDKQHLARP